MNKEGKGMGEREEEEEKRESLQYAVSKRNILQKHVNLHPAQCPINGLTCNDHKRRAKYTEYLWSAPVASDKCCI